MRTVVHLATVLVLGAATALAAPQTAASPHTPRKSPITQRKSVKPASKRAEQPQPPPAPVYPPRPEQMPAVQPQVSYINGQLTVQAENCRLSDILTAIQQRTGAQIEIPPSAATERVAAMLGPGTPQHVLKQLLGGSRFDYMILGSDTQPGGVSKVIVTLRPPVGSTGATTVASRATPTQTSAPDYNPDSDEEEESPRPQPTPAPAPYQPPFRGGSPQQQHQQQQQQQQQPTSPIQGATIPGEPAVPTQQTPAGQQAQQQGQQPGQQQVKTPEQLLREIQQMQQKNSQQNNPPQ